MTRTNCGQLTPTTSLISVKGSARFTCWLAALAIASPLFAADPAATLQVTGDVQIKKPASDFVPLDSTAQIPSGSELKTGAPGEVTLDFARGVRGVLESNGGLLFTGAQNGTTQQVPAGFTNTGSAIKSLLTHNDTQPTRVQNTLPQAAVWLRQGTLISAVKNSRQRIDLPVALILATESGFVSTIESPTSVRISVIKGFVTVGLPDGRTVPVTNGQYARIKKIKSGIGYVLIGPASVEKEELAQADIARYAASGAKLALEPVAELVGNSGPRPPGGVGTGLSAPFDLGRDQRLTTPPNPVNVLPPAISFAR
jgi:hypothetical protein